MNREEERGASLNKAEEKALLEPRQVVSTQHGKGKIKTINHTYSIPLYLAELTEGRFKGDTLALTETEFKEVK